MIDSHCHLDRAPGEAADLVAAAAAAGVERILTVGLDEQSNRAQIALAEAFDPVFVAVGRHPNDADGFDEAAADDIRELARHDRVRAIGETGLDCYRDTADPENQRLAFSAQIGIAVETGLPLVIHLRDRQDSEEAAVETFRMLDAASDELTVILHCFSVPDRVEDAVNRGWYCSFAGNVTYPANESLRVAVAKVPDELILVETDSPYLTPQSKRRERNEPAFVVETATLVASLRGTAPDEFDRIVTENSGRLFGW
jgi:TatD DNase family protein